MTTNLKVKTSGRLHMGFFDLHGGLGRKFGSIGLSLNAPNLVIEAQLAETLKVSGAASIPVAVVSKATLILQQLVNNLNLPDAVTLNIEQAIPEHAGLGSGTQLALAVGAAVNRLYKLNLTTTQIAKLTGRGGRSGIGIAAFDTGGLIIDGGRVLAATNTSIPPLLVRYKFPEDWSILLIFDASQPGVHGEQEKKAFNQLPIFPENLAALLCRHVLMQAMPAIAERDLTAFGQSIQVLQKHVGDYFSPVQGGRYASALVGSVLEYLQQTGVVCFGQSSWGPTGFAIFENSEVAQNYLQQLKIKYLGQALTWQICSACNHGAELIV